MKSIKDVFIEYLKNNKLKYTSQREVILNLFLRTEHHVSTDEFYKIISKRYPGIGHSTVFRTLKHIAKSGIAREVDFGDGIIRYEHKLGHEHHDHLICLKCGRFIEVLSPKIEKLQESLAKKHDFTVISHKMELFGYCSMCRRK